MRILSQVGVRGSRRALTIIAITLCTQVSGVAVAALARADTSYDLATIAGNYDNTAQPNGAYVFEQVSNLAQLEPSATTYLPATNRYDDTTDTSGNGGGVHGYAGSEVDSGFAFPQFLTNATSQLFQHGLAFAPAHSFYFHPGNELAGVIDFTVPGGAAETLSASVRLESRNYCDCGDVNSYLFAASSTGTIIGGAPTVVDRSGGNVATFSLPPTAVPAGGHVYLVINDAGGYGYDGTGVAETVTIAGSPAASLPESGLAVTLPLAAITVMGSAVLLRRRRRGRTA